MKEESNGDAAGQKPFQLAVAHWSESGHQILQYRYCSPCHARITGQACASLHESTGRTALLRERAMLAAAI